MAENNSAFPAGAHVKAPDGTHIELRPLSLRDIADVDQAALTAYRKQAISGVIETSEIRWGKGSDKAEAKIDAALEKLAELTVDRLPLFQGIPKVDARLTSEDGTPLIDVSKPLVMPWPAYWMSFTMDGLIFVTWLSARRATVGMTFEVWDQKLTEWGSGFVKELSDKLAEINRSKLGNQQPPT